MLIREGDSSLVRKCKHAMRENLSKHYQREHEIHTLHLATVVDPCFKQLQWMEAGERDNIYQELEVEMLKYAEVQLLTPIVKQEPVSNGEARFPEPYLPRLPSTGPDLPRLPNIEPDLPSREPDLPRLPGIEPDLPVLSNGTEQKESPERKKTKSGWGTDVADDFFDILFLKEEKGTLKKKVRVQQEKKRYLSEHSIPINQDPLKWWSLQKRAFRFVPRPL